MVLKTKQLAIGIILAVLFTAIPLKADNFIRVYATYSGTQDTVGMAEHFLLFGTKIPVFLPPYTIHLDIHPLAEDKFKAEIDCYELAPGYKDYHEEKEIEAELNKIKQVYQQDEQMKKKAESLEFRGYLRTMLLNRKAVEFLIEKATKK